MKWRLKRRSVIMLESLYPKLGLMRVLVLLLLLTQVMRLMMTKLLQIVRVSKALLTTRRRRAYMITSMRIPM